jgi:hypothetical protein
MNARELEAAIDCVLKPRGFVKRGSSWFRAYHEAIVVIDLQKSEYGGQYYTNLGVSLRSLNADSFPREEQCHVRVRLERVLAAPVSITEALNLEDASLTDLTRRKLIQRDITKAVDWLEQLSTIEALSRRLSSDESLRNRSTLEVRRFLKIN